MSQSGTDVPATAAEHCRRGLALQGLQRHDEAVAAFRAALILRPDSAELHASLGAALVSAGHPEQATAACAAAIRLKPDLAEAHCNAGAAWLAQGRLGEAASALGTALRLKPDHAEAHCNLGAVLQAEGRFPEALSAIATAFRLRPDSVEIGCSLAFLLRLLGRYDAAVPVYRAILRSHPECAEAHSGLGGSLLVIGEPEAALAACRTAVRLKPGYAEGHCNLGCVLRDLGRSDAAVAAFRTALGLKPDFPDCESQLGMALLERGEAGEGWQKFQGARQHRLSRRDPDDVGPPVWNGEAAEGRTLLIRAEHGLGDTLQFCRLATAAAQRGLRVILEVQPPLVRLLGSLAGVEQVVACGDALPPCDWQCPMFSLPLLVGSAVGSPPYLHADPVEAQAWGARLAAVGRSGPRVGVAWAGASWPAGSFRWAMDRGRSLAPERLAPLFDVPGLHFVSLQTSPPPAPTEFALTDFTADLRDLADTAALVANLDLVVSVDTAVVHLAGAIGTPVWLMDRFNHCWRWLNGQQDSPWYPGLRIHRQRRHGEWDPIVADIARALGVLAGGARRQGVIA